MKRCAGFFACGLMLWAAMAADGAMLDNYYGKDTFSSFATAERNTGTGSRQWVGEDFYLDSELHPDYAYGMEVDEVRWIGQVNTTSDYLGAEIMILEYVGGAYDAEAGTYSGGAFQILRDPTGETPVSFGVREPGTEDAFAAEFPSMQSPDILEFSVAIDPIVLESERLYVFAARLVGDREGSHAIASVGTHGDSGLEADHNMTMGAGHLWSSGWSYDWRWVEEAPFSITSNNEFAYQLYGTVMPEPSSVLLVLLGGVLLRRR